MPLAPTPYSAWIAIPSSSSTACSTSFSSKDARIDVPLKFVPRHKSTARAIIKIQVMAEDTACPRCAEPVPSGETDCPYCAGRRPYPFLPREPVLVAAIFAIAIGLWLVTHGVTQAYGHRQDHLARTWYAQGDRKSVV